MELREPKDYVGELKQRSAAEPIASFLDMRLEELLPGYARVSMTVKPEHQNFNGMTFGGIIMALADQAFAYGSNSLAFPSVATQFNIHFVSGPRVGEEIIAECRVVKSGRRVGISEITVSTREGKLVARVTGTTIPTGEKG